MPAFFAKRGTTMPSYWRDNMSGILSNAETIQTDTAESASRQKQSVRPHSSVILIIGLSVLLAGIGAAASICYVNNMRLVDNIANWVNDGKLSLESTATEGGLGQRAYSYGEHPTLSATTLDVSSTDSITTVTVTSHPTESVTPVAPESPSFSTAQNTININSTETITTINTMTLTQTVFSTFPTNLSTVTSVANTIVTATNTVIASQTVTQTFPLVSNGSVSNAAFSSPASGPAPESVTIGNPTVTETSISITMISVTSNSTITLPAASPQISSQPLPVTMTATVTVIPVPSINSASTIQESTTTSLVWSSGWNSSWSSHFGPSAATVIFTTTTTELDNCTDISSTSVVTTYSNDAVTASIPQSSSIVNSGPVSTSSSNSTIATFHTTQLRTRTLTTTIDYGTVSSSSCTECSTMNPEMSTDTYTSTETKTHTPPIAVTHTTITTISLPFSGTGTTVGQSVTGTQTVVSVSSTAIMLSPLSTLTVTELPLSSPSAQNSVSTITYTVSVTPSAGMCTSMGPVTVTATVISTMTVPSDDVVVAQSASKLASVIHVPISTSTSMLSAQTDRIPLVSISPNTTFSLTGHRLSTSTVTFCNKTETHNIIAGSAITSSSNDAITGPSATNIASSLTAHGIPDLSISTMSTLSRSISQSVASLTPNGTEFETGMMTTVGTGIPIATVYTTTTVSANETLIHPNATVALPTVSVSVSAGEKKQVNKAWGPSTGSSSITCAVMMVSVFMLF